MCMMGAIWQFLFNIVYFFPLLFGVLLSDCTLPCAASIFISLRKVSVDLRRAMRACDSSTTSDNKSCEFLMCLTC